MQKKIVFLFRFLILSSGSRTYLPVPFVLMSIKFTKMHGLGNDFVVINGLEQDIELDRDQLQLIGDRHRGIGCDQILLLQPSDDPTADVRYRIFNADGNEVEHCGNGVRCVGVYLSQNGYVSSDIIRVETINGSATIFYLESNDQVRIDMGVPRFEPIDIPLLIDTRQEGYLLELSVRTTSVMAVSMGNPHAVLIVDDVERAPVATLGSEIQANSLFPKGVNVGFMEITDPAHIRLRVFERGVGETLACGTGACAATVLGNMVNRLNNRVDIELNGGHLEISWAGEGEHVWMTGPATTVYEGQITI